MTRQVLVVLQSRLTSSRLPGKALLTVGDRPMVVLAAQRAANTGYPVVVATSDQAEDDIIEATCARRGVRVARGPLDDTLARFVRATDGLGDDDIVVRLTADNVVPDGALVAELVEALTGPDAAGRRYVRLGGDDRALPYGVAAEAFTAGVLREAAASSTETFDREHVTPAIKRALGDWRITPTDVSPTWEGLRCTVDAFDDVVTVARLFAGFEDPLAPSWRELCDLLSGTARRSTLPVRGSSAQNPIGQSALVLGTVQLGLAYGAANAAGQPDAAQALAVLDAARRAGITHLDTARAYGDSEQRIGAANARGLAEDVGVVTKLQPLEDGAGRDAASASLERSLRLLRTDRLAAVLVHRAADWHRPGVADRLAEAVADGTAALAGASIGSPDELIPLLADPRCGYIQLPYNLLDRRWLAPEAQAALAARPDVVITARSAFLQGLLTAGAGARWPLGHEPEDVVPVLDRLVADLGRVSRADLCLAYVLGHPWVTSVVVGAETPEQVSDLAALVGRAPLTAAELEQVRQALAAGTDDLVDPSRWRSR